MASTRLLGRAPRLVAAAAVVAVCAAVAGAALTRTGGARSSHLPLGPEGVPVPAAPPLAPARALAPGGGVDGIACQPSEQVLFHVHAHLSLFVRGRARQVPAGIGVGAPTRFARAPSGAFAVGGSCFSWLHTHAADGVIHVESPVDRAYTLGELFDIWGQPLGRRRVGPARGRVTALADGRAFAGDPRSIPLVAHAQIQIEVGRPLVPFAPVEFRNGL